MELVLNKKLYMWQLIGQLFQTCVVLQPCFEQHLGTVICNHSLCWWFHISTIQSMTHPPIHPVGRRTPMGNVPKVSKESTATKKFFYSFCSDLMFSEYSLLCLAINCPANILAGFLFLICLKKHLYDILCLFQVLPQTLLQTAFLCIHI